MKHIYKTMTTFGSDGGGEYNSYIGGDKIGYSDGLPFVSAAQIQSPFSTAQTIIPPFNRQEKICGISYGYFANRGEIRSEEGKQSQKLMYKLNNNWVCLAITNYQKTYHSTQIYSDYLRTPTDRDIQDFVIEAHGRGVKVCLKPMIHSEDNVWRAHISFPDLNMSDSDTYWEEWFESYKNFILHYAELAQELGVEMLCIGGEMLGTEHRKYDWLYIIKEVRRVYTGKIVYNTNNNHEDDQDWFDVLDYIGISAYYNVYGDGTYTSMIDEWQKIRWRLDAIAKNRNKQFIFTEVGCRSVKGAARHPWDIDKDLPFSEQEQDYFYASLFEVFRDDPYFAGVFWWNWPTFQYNTRKEALKDKSFNIHLKLAERTVQREYAEMIKNDQL